jgi:hypothetical protein
MFRTRFTQYAGRLAAAGSILAPHTMTIQPALCEDDKKKSSDSNLTGFATEIMNKVTDPAGLSKFIADHPEIEALSKKVHF